MSNSKCVVYYHLVFLFVSVFALEYIVSLAINKNYGMPSKDKQQYPELFQPLTIPAAVISEPIDRRIDKLFWHGLMRPRDYSNEQAGTEHCAEWSNRELRKMGYDIWGDAWTRTNNPGLTKVISGYDGLDRPSEYKYSDVKEYLLDAADNVKKGLDWRDLQEGDMVGMYFRTSPSLKKAYEKGANGEAQTHTGHVVYRNGKPYVAHNVHGDVIVNKAKKVMGRNHPWGIVSVYRPSKKKADGGALSSSRPDVATVYKHLLEFTNGDFNKAMQIVDAGYGRMNRKTFTTGGPVSNQSITPYGDAVNPDAVRFAQQVAKLQPYDTSFGFPLEGLYWQPGEASLINDSAYADKAGVNTDEYGYLSEVPQLISLPSRYGDPVDISHLRGGDVGAELMPVAAESTGMPDLARFYSGLEPKQSLASRVLEYKILGGNKSDIINDAISELKNGDDLRDFQELLYRKGYYGDVKAKMPKIANRSEEAYELQRMLVENGYDIGGEGIIDGIIGEKTKKAYEQYMKDNNVDLLLQQVANGKMDSATINAARKYLTAVYDTNDEDVDTTPLSQKIYSSVTPREFANYALGYVVPAFTNAGAIKAVNSLLGVDDKLADDYIAAKEALDNARATGDEQAIADAEKLFRKAKSKLPPNILNPKKLSTAEKKSSTAIITSLNGDKLMTYEDYLRIVKKLGRQPGDFIGTNEPAAYDRTSYHVSNDKEDRGNGKYDKTKEARSLPYNLLQGLIRVFDDPNRGRLGGWSYRVLPDGSYEIRDDFSATEKRAARGKNDSGAYNAARDAFPRASRAPFGDIITAEEIQKYVNEAKSKGVSTTK